MRSRLLPAVLSLLITVSASGREFEQMRVDLDADHRLETVSLTITGNGPTQSFTLEIAGARYTEDFFAGEGDLPELSLVRIDRSRGTRQLLVQTRSPHACRFHLLAYADHKIHRLLRVDTNAECQAPVSRGNGEIEVLTHEGFWERSDTFLLASTGTLVTRVPVSTYDVGREGTAAADLDLAEETCAEHSVARGSRLEVVRYDSSAARYLIRAEGGLCGWLPADGLDAKIAGLPWHD